MAAGQVTPAGSGSPGIVGILISGRGSNMLAIADACAAGRIAARVGIVISNEPGAPGLAAARQRGIETLVLDHRESRGRQEYDARLAAALDRHSVDLVCLAGYMRLLSPGFVAERAGRIMNVHPALLPAFPGLHAQRQAVEHGVRLSGATVHFVDAGLDSGPIILQAAVPVEQDDTEETLSARILVEEHRLYPEAIRLHFEHRLRIEGRRVRILGR
ncbi:MAG TPA: phosphoribosylglycinamide formyltransferase [Candidatus Polarisedimenticolia bacterium]|nr:phosphoribosylglycinamide formyltransferase [Candidatus Polarisedimenticolia bacterium]